MRNTIGMSAAAVKPVGRPPLVSEQRLIQAVTLGFWTPCCVADLWLLHRGGTDAARFVFWLLFREAVVFLTLWFVAAVSRGLLCGSREPQEPGARQRRKLWLRLTGSPDVYTAPSRGYRGQ